MDNPLLADMFAAVAPPPVAIEEHHPPAPSSSSAPPAPQPPPPPSSSEADAADEMLNSDDDASQSAELETENRILCLYDNYKRTGGRRRYRLLSGIVQLEDTKKSKLDDEASPTVSTTEYVFKEAAADFRFN